METGPSQFEQPVQLGLFELHTRLCSGGMGEIWKGSHTKLKVPVAIKVITRAKARTLKYLAGIRNEVRAVARLDHPGIVMVFDHGEVPPQAEKESGGALVAGSPYLVMEYASRGSLDQLQLPLRWREIKIILMSVLDALAHAHARGVIHRDLKPGNLLFAGRKDIRPGPKLTDFGLAHALEVVSHNLLTESVIGTPNYMAPEQLCGLWRDFGPWTDLYALGCMAYQLATGRLPFTNEDYHQLALDHMFTPPPRFTFTHALPKGFEGWVMRLLQKVPRQRFQRAADAAAALMLLGEPQPSDPASPSGIAPLQQKAPPSQREAITTPTLPSLDDYRVVHTTLSLHPPTGDRAGSASRPQQPDEPSEPVLCPLPAVYVPPTWDRPTLPTPSLELIGVGLNLFGLRTIPLVDRQPELELMWKCLKQVHEQGRPQLVFLRGPAGCGKTRLVEWIGERAHEVGVATVLKAVHSPTGGPGSGIPRMVANHLGCVGLPRAEVLARAKWFVRELGIADDYQWNALTELMMPAGEADLAGGVRAIRFSRPTERYVLVRRLLERLTLERPVIVWLEDVQWGSDSISFAHHVIGERSARPLPVLFILTARDEALAMRQVESRQLKELLSLEDTLHLPVGPLQPADHSALVRSLLYLEGELAEQVEKRTYGNPLFAVQLVGDWVRRGVLDLGPNGFVLRPGEEAVLPDNIHLIWNVRIEQLLDEYAVYQQLGEEPPVDREQVRVALELAAVLGQDVDMNEWRDACQEASVPYPEHLPDILLSHRLANPIESGWLFVHGMLRESLERHARESGRWHGLNRTCAVMLRRRYPSLPPGISERIGLHLFEAGDLAASLEPLTAGVLDRFRASDFQPALNLLDQREAILDALGATDSDRQRAVGCWWRARILLHQSDFENALDWAQSAARVARQAEASDILADSLRLAAIIARWRGQLADSIALLRQAVVLGRSAGNDRSTSRALCQFGISVLDTGDLDQALETLQEAQSMQEESGELEDRAHTLLGMARVAQERYQVEFANRLVQQALEIYSQQGNRHGVATCWNAIGVNLRLQGHLDAAELSYQKSIDLFSSLGTTVDAMLVRTNLTILQLERKQYPQARKELEEMARLCAERSLRSLLTDIQLLLLVPAAARRDWTTWDHHYTRATTLLSETGRVCGDLAWAARLAGDLTSDGGDKRRAAQAYRLSRQLWNRLGRSDRVSELDTLLESYS
ncbi:MAG: tetratricopeptide repeat protein [Bradymonadales bacterium]|nr:tetratricopeptide repeat protein [Bradymonadales bacterium]